MTTPWTTLSMAAVVVYPGYGGGTRVWGMGWGTRVWGLRPCIRLFDPVLGYLTLYLGYLTL